MMGHQNDGLLALGQGAATGFWPQGEVPGAANMTRFFEKKGSTLRRMR